jgi:threonine/homoserine/homoserine lactone efflux protein
MFGIHDYGVFLLASFALHAVPGQDVLFVVAQSLSGGRRAGVLAAVGVGTGSLVHTAVVALGLGAVLASFPAVLHAIRLAGAAYLVVLALSCLRRARRPSSDPDSAPAVPGHVSFRQGFVTNVANAKVLLFYLAFLPQFVTPDRADASLGFLLLGLSFATTGTLWNAAVAAGASALEPVLLRSRNGRRLLDACAGFLLLAIAIPILWRR